VYFLQHRVDYSANAQCLLCFAVAGLSTFDKAENNVMSEIILNECSSLIPI